METSELEPSQKAPSLVTDYYVRIQGMGWDAAGGHPNPPVVSSSFQPPPVVEVLTSLGGYAYYKLTLPRSFDFLIATVHKTIEDSPRQDLEVSRDEDNGKVWYLGTASNLMAVFCLHLRGNP